MVDWDHEIYLDPASEARGVLPNLYYLRPGAPRFATKTTNFERRAKRALKNDSPSPYSLLVHPKFPQKTSTFDIWEVKLRKITPSLLCKGREVSLSPYPLLVHHNLPQKPALLRGEQSEPCKMTPTLSSKAREVSLSPYPLLVHLDLPQKPALLRGEQSESWKCDSLSGAKREKFPLLHTPYWCSSICHKN